MRHAFFVSLALLMGVGTIAQAQTDVLCTLIVDAETGATLREDGDCDSRVTPASTFKIPLAVMGYEAGILTDMRTPVMTYQAGDPDWGGANWTRDTDPASWMRFSVVWYSQRITRRLGADTLSRYAQAFGYGNGDFSGDVGFDNGLERAWIASSLRVSPREQTAFLRALLRDALPVQPTAMSHARALVESTEVRDWLIHGKTGAAYPRRADRSFDYDRGWGWYVGWANNAERRLVFAHLTQTRTRSAGSPGNRARDAFLSAWPDMIR